MKPGNHRLSWMLWPRRESLRDPRRSGPDHDSSDHDSAERCQILQGNLRDERG